MAQMQIHVILTKNEPDEEWRFTARCVEFPGAISDGRTEREALDNVVTAVEDIIRVRRQEARKVVRRKVSTRAQHSRPRMRTAVLHA